MTDQKTNVAVAERLGLDFHVDEWEYVLILDRVADTKKHPPSHPLGEMEYIFETKCYGVKFSPATDPAAAKFASEALGRDFFLTYDSKTELWGAAVEADDRSYGTFCQAICAAILA